MVKRILLPTDNVYVINFFSEILKEHFTSFGYEAELISLSTVPSFFDSKLIIPNETVIVTFDLLGLDLVYNKDILKNNILIYDILVDHPYYFKDGLTNLKYLHNHYIFTIDKKHSSFLQNNFGIDNTFLPLGGTSVQTKNVIPYKEKKNQICFTGSVYLSYSYNTLNNIDKITFNKIFQLLKKNNALTIEEAFEIKSLPLDKSDFVLMDSFIRNYYRYQVVNTLIKSGIPMIVIGDGWSDNNYLKNNVIIKEYSSTKECIQIINESKICLNVMPWFKDGLHDRLLNGCLNECLCFTDNSLYLSQVFTNKKDLIIYNPNDVKELCNLVRYYLDSPDEAEQIAKSGRAIAEKDHTWYTRALQIEKDFTEKHNAMLKGVNNTI